MIIFMILSSLTEDFRLAIIRARLSILVSRILRQSFTSRGLHHVGAS